MDYAEAMKIGNKSKLAVSLIEAVATVEELREQVAALQTELAAKAKPANAVSTVTPRQPRYQPKAIVPVSLDAENRTITVMDKVFEIPAEANWSGSKQSVRVGKLTISGFMRADTVLAELAAVGLRELVIEV